MTTLSESPQRAPDSTRTFEDLPQEVSERPALAGLQNVPVPEPLKDPVDPQELGHREFATGEFWRTIPGYRDVDAGTFMDPQFQIRNSLTSPTQLRELFRGELPMEFIEDCEKGFGAAPMNVRVTPYLLSCIDWDNFYEDPIRIQFLPTASTRLPDHPRLSLDSLHEEQDSPVPGLVHRYPDKALFLPLDVCPVYCRYCTRSYAVGGDTELVEKSGQKPRPERWQQAFVYVASRPEIEDIVVSGGDAYMLPARRLKDIVGTFLEIPHVRRVRIATKGPAVMPMKILTDDGWTDALVELSDRGRELHKEVCLHTHFNSPAEITDISRRAMNLLFERGVKVRNQSVVVAGVNDDPDTMVEFVRQLSFMNVQPYYVYQHDMVKGVEELRTTVGESMELERHVRGATAGFNTPTFVTDVPGGGGKRDIHSFDHYDEVTGISVYRSPAVDEDRAYLYFDPILRLPSEGQQRWARPAEHELMIKEALMRAGLSGFEVTTA